MNIFLFFINENGGEQFVLKHASMSRLGVKPSSFCIFICFLLVILFCFCFLFSEKELVTPALDGLILPGITRFSILELTRGWNEFKVSERKITMADVIKMTNENRVSLEFLVHFCPLLNSRLFF